MMYYTVQSIYGGRLAAMAPVLHTGNDRGFESLPPYCIRGNEANGLQNAWKAFALKRVQGSSPCVSVLVQYTSLWGDLWRRGR